VNDHQGQGLSVEWARDGPRPWRRPAASSLRGARRGRGAERRASVPASRRPVAARRHASFRQRTQPISAEDQASGAGTPRIVRAGPSSVKGTRRSFLTAPQKRSSGPRP
jgi:hypothetical protein